MPHASKPVRPGAAGYAADLAVRGRSEARIISIRNLEIHCQTCSVRGLCLPVGLATEAMSELDRLIGHRIRVTKHAALYRAGAEFHFLYAIHTGMLKTSVVMDDGRDQVMGYHMSGDIVGFDGIDNEHYSADAAALEDTEVCALPFSSIENLARTLPSLQRNLSKLISSEMTQDRGMMLVLGSMKAEERMATFLLNLGDRYRRRGYSQNEFELRLTRDEIGSYLGLRLETVSRIFSRFHSAGLIQVQGRTVKLLDLAALKVLGGQGHRNPAIS